MQATTYDPSTISLSEDARVHVRKQLSSEQASSLMLDITESGCNGYMYALKFLDSIPSEVHVFEFDDDIKIVVHNDHWEMIRGTHIELVTEGLNSFLRFENPNAESHCGCGESFSIRGT